MVEIIRCRKDYLISRFSQSEHAQEKSLVTTCRDEDFLRRHPSLVELTDFICIGFLQFWNSSDFRVATHSGVHDQFCHMISQFCSRRIGRQSLRKVDKRLVFRKCATPNPLLNFINGWIFYGSQERIQFFVHLFIQPGE